MITGHRLNRDSNKTQESYVSDGFLGGMTTIRPNRSRKVHHNRFEGDLARCSIYDLSNHKIVSDESVVNGGTYELLYIRGIYILEDSQRPIQPSSNDLWKEIKSLKTSLQQVSEQVDDLNPKSFPRFYVWKSGDVTNETHYPMIFNEVEYNDGNMYDVKSGRAIIQHDGMYIFGTSVYTKPDSGRVTVSIYINGKVLARATEQEVS